MNSYNSIKEVREFLVPKGFHEYRPSELDKCNYSFQKRYDDEIGKKYFIDAHVFDWSRESRLPENFYVEYFTQLYQCGTHNAVNLTFIDWNLEQVEAFVEDLFVNKKIEYYETWEES